MYQTLHWKKGIFSCTFQLLAGGFPVGQLKDSEFSRKAHGNLNNKAVTFQRCEGLHPNIKLLDTQSGRQLGRITFNPWYPKAYIQLGTRQATWTYSNLWECRWKISDRKGVIVTCSGWQSKGEMTILEQDDLLVLAGLYIANYYWQLTAILIAVFIAVVFIPSIFS